MPKRRLLECDKQTTNGKYPRKQVETYEEVPLFHDDVKLYLPINVTEVAREPRDQGALDNSGDLLVTLDADLRNADRFKVEKQNRKVYRFEATF